MISEGSSQAEDCSNDAENKHFTIVLNQNPDVARPDKISGADINSICQEVS